MIKRFLEWIGLKEKIHIAIHKPPFFREGEIWWCHTGENIGNEMNGKGDKFTRPVCILKKYDSYSFFGLPLTTKDKSGTWYSNIHFKNKKQVIVLSQGRTFDYRRLKEKMGELNTVEQKQMRDAFINLHI